MTEGDVSNDDPPVDNYVVGRLAYSPSRNSRDCTEAVPAALIFVPHSRIASIAIGIGVLRLILVVLYAAAMTTPLMKTMPP